MPRILFLVVFAHLFLCGCSSSQSLPPSSSGGSDQSPIDVAEKELQKVRTGGNWELLELGTPADADKAVLGQPLPVYFANATELGNYSGGDLNRILHKTNHVVFPVLVNGKGVMFIEVGKNDGKWSWIKDGYQDSATALPEEKKDTGSAKVPVTSMMVMSSINESNLLITGKAQAAAPGGGNEPVPPDLNNVTQVMQLSGPPLVTPPDNQPVKIDVSQRIVIHNLQAYIVNRQPAAAAAGPGAAPANPAQDFFKAIAPIAKQAAAAPSKGPG